MYLGIDLSTQSLTGVVVDPETRIVVARSSIAYDSALPQYGSINGLLPSGSAALKHADPRMWVAALRELLSVFARLGLAGRIRGIGLAAQQRGTVYLRDHRSWDLLGSDADLSRELARPTAPTWMDDCARDECSEIQDFCGGAENVRAITGSVPMARSSGPQIRRFFRTDPVAYAETDLITIPSSFATAFLVGHDVPMEEGDAAATCLLDVEQRSWSSRLLDATAPDLRRRLPPLCALGGRAGTLNQTIARAFGFGASVPVVIGTGDNLASAVALDVLLPGAFAASLGSSHTLFAATPAARRDVDGWGSVLPLPEGKALGITVLRNGALTLNHLLASLGMGIDQLDAVMARTVPGNSGLLMLPFLYPEIAPQLNPLGLRVIGGLGDPVPEAVVRGLVEAQAIRLRVHGAWLGKPGSLAVTGGSSQSSAFAQVVSDVFGSVVTSRPLPDGAALGAALIAAATVERALLPEIAQQFFVGHEHRAIDPRPGMRGVYDDLIARYEDIIPACMAASANNSSPPGSLVAAAAGDSTHASRNVIDAGASVKLRL